MGYTIDKNGGKTWDGYEGGGYSGQTPEGQTSTNPGTAGYKGTATQATSAGGYKGTPVIKPQYQPPVSQPAPSSYVADSAAQIKKAQAEALASLKTTYDDQLASQLGTYNTQRALIPGQTATNNNQASSQGMQNANHIRTALAQMGLLQSGESASQQLINDVGTGSNINANNLAGQNLDASFADKITAAQAQNAMDYNNAAYQYGRNAVGDSAAAAALQQQANQWQQTFNQQQAQDTFNNGIAQGTLTGYYNGIYYKNGVATNNPSSSPTANQSASLPPALASAYPGATNVTKSADGHYSFTRADGGISYVSG